MKANILEQQQRFENLITANAIDLIKLGKKVIFFIQNDNGCFNHYNFITRILKLYNISGSMVHPLNPNRSYRDIITQKAVIAYVNSLQNR
jgi:hypothetical protein